MYLRALAYALGLAANVDAVAGATVADLLCVALASVLMPMRVLSWAQQLRLSGAALVLPVPLLLTVLFLGYAAGQSLSDLAAGSTGDAGRDLFRMLSILAIAWVMAFGERASGRFVARVLIGYGVGRVLWVALIGDLDPGRHDLWRHDLGEGVSLALAGIAAFRGRWSAVAIVGIVAVLNMVLDFRGMSLTMLLLAAYLAMQGQGARGGAVRLAALAVAGLIGLGVIYAFQATQDESGARRQQSNIIRYAMTVHAVQDMLRPSLLGHGFGHFQKAFSIPSVDNPGLEQTIEGETPLHGYLLLASYEAGKLGLLFYLALLVLSALRLKAGLGPAPRVLDAGGAAVLIYLSYSSFMHAFAGFDRWVLAMALGLLLAGWSGSRPGIAPGAARGAALPAATRPPEGA